MREARNTLPPCDHDECEPTKCKREAGSRATFGSPFILGIEAALADAKGETGDGVQNPFKGDCQKSDVWMRGYYRVSQILKSEANVK